MTVTANRTAGERMDWSTSHRPARSKINWFPVWHLSEGFLTSEQKASNSAQ
jgi:hypothetical protein